MTTPVLQTEKLSMVFPNGNKALDAVDLSLHPGRALALVGESGSGKSTCAKLLTHMLRPTSGRILFQGRDITGLSGRRELLEYRRVVQMVFQDPFAALNPAHTVAHHLARPLALHRPDLDRAGRGAEVRALLTQVELDADSLLHRFPHELSGGQRQRVSLARALAVNPAVIIADEPTSMLDVSIRLSVLDTLQRLKAERDIALLYITHDIATARYVAEETAVLFRGRVVESGPTAAVIDGPRHPYTRLLLSAVPDAGRPFDAGGSLISRADAVRRLSEGPGDLVYVGPGHKARTVDERVAA
ncbi:ABC transporter ATP-binding protein [Nitrospirillum viridazoti]|uniref:Dipeptide/oligopeptide/nickel ABC transporter ATP-binding protein n=1 Tax=Nitrospirillum viridazoti CBAmc TaxID=1441467 RepID=A0A248JMY7_9PROT|nr:ABC transporter ATP-binding protein [Nitrospirillum amazonense]ASG19830.1 dipeptide/oligopeptide/nickel ABC transporter ATP-binding protein [Nitrospirillum amazonense CBAmc]TWB30374.1 oligopeptide/dipeptide transporter [Nitrospirillum amazonense]